MIYEHVFAGCAPVPLAHYLKALGVLRLVAEQADPDAAGSWRRDQFVLRTTLNQEELENFFLQQYRPTPIIAPWNGGSGFHPKDNKTGIDAISSAKTERLGLYKEVIEQGHKLVADKEKNPLLSEKFYFLQALRARLPDQALTWFDAAVMLLTDKPGYPPLLGTGGNDGRLDFTNNFMQRVVDLFDPGNGLPTPKSFSWLQGALYNNTVNGLEKKAIGQFAPGSAGGPNAGVGFSSETRMNPWDYILMMEGALVFAGAVTRRLADGSQGALSYPFTVRTTGSGSGGGNIADESQSRAEIWLPLWSGFIGITEILTLFTDGRVAVGRRLARDGLDFARAVCNFGVDRGIFAFQRYAFFMRSGKAYLATPLNRIKVSRNPKTDLLSHLDRNNWLDRLRHFARNSEAPGRIRLLVRRLEDELFALTKRGDRQNLQNVIVFLGQIQLACASSAKARDSVAPVPRLGSEWAMAADDGTNEFRLACSLAAIMEKGSYVVPISHQRGRIAWDPGSRQAVWAGAGLVANLLKVLERRLLVAKRNSEADDFLAGRPVADLAAVSAFLDGLVDETRLAGLLTGLITVDLPAHLPKRDHLPKQPPAVYSLVKPLFTSDRILRDMGMLPPDKRLPLPSEVAVLLRAGNRSQLDRAVSKAWRTLRSAGLELPRYPNRPPQAIGTDGARLTVALMVPLGKGDLAKMWRPLMAVDTVR